MHIRIRQIYIPELILRLHGLFLQSRHIVPKYVAHTNIEICLLICLSRALAYAFELINVVADARYKLYDDFAGEGGRPLADYLGTVRTAVLAGLENGGSDPFRVLQTLDQHH